MEERTVKQDLIDALAREIRHPRRARRISAAMRLAEATDARADSVLIDALGDRSWAVRQAILASLARRNRDRPVEPLLSALGLAETVRESERPAGEILTSGLWRFARARPVDSLIEGVREPGPLRPAFASALGELGDRRAVDALLEALADPRSGSGTRQAAVEALGKLRDERAIDRLIASLDDPSRSVRRAARRSLVGLGSRALPALEARIRQRGRTGRYHSQRARRKIARAIDASD